MFSGKRAAIGLVIFTAVSAGAVQAGSPPVAAPASASTGAQNAAGQVRAWLQRAVAWSSGYFTLMHEQGVLLRDVNERVRLALRARNADTAEVKAWAETQRSRLAAVDQEAVAMQDRPFPEPPAIVAQYPGFGKAMATYPKLPAVVSRRVHQNSDLARSVIDQIVLAASGEPAARQALARQTIELDIAMIEGENTIVEASNAATPENNPQWDLATCSEESNLAALDVLRLVQRGMTGEAGDDQAAVAKAVRTHAQRMAALADAMDRDAHAVLATMPRSGEAQTMRLAENAKQAIELFILGAANERDIAKGLEQVATRLDDPKAPAADALSAIGAIAPLEQRRLALVEQRRQLFAQ